MRKSIVAGAVVIVVGLVGAAGCSSPPEEEPSASTEQAIFGDSRTCYMSSVSRRYNVTCDFGGPNDNLLTAIDLAVSAGGCIASAVGVVATATGPGLLLTASTVAGVSKCLDAIGRFLSGGYRWNQCTRTEVAPGPPENPDACAMSCRGTQRTVGGVCYCAVVPGGCDDAPAAPVTPTPGPPRCASTSSTGGCSTCALTSAGRANCSGPSRATAGAVRVNIEGTLHYKCTTSGWRACL